MIIDQSNEYLDFNVDCWLEVRISGDIQSPRVQLGSVGYAYMASGVVPGTEVSGPASQSMHEICTPRPTD